MNQEQYIAERVDDQMEWLSKKAAFNQKKYKQLRVLQLSCTASIPFLVATLSDGHGVGKWVVGILGVILTISEGVEVLYKYKDLWLQYRSAAEALKREKLLFLTSSGRYGDATEAFTVFVAKVESILANENTQWRVQLAKENKPTKDNP